MNTVRINTGKPYDVIVGSGLLSQLPEFLKQYSHSTRMMIVTDSNVAPLYLKRTEDILSNAGYPVFSFIFEAGENSKCLSTVEKLYSKMSQSNITRTDLVIALGGGIVGDLAGFAAATFLRGIDFVQVPTTLLAAVDASVGGKTAVNTPEGKNLIGAFHQPVLTVCDIDLMSTLSKEIFTDGISEVIKYGVIWDKALFDLVATGKLSEHLQEIVTRCVEIKGEIVSQDETEKGVRVFLNFGHTLAHGIEMHSDHKVSHGGAVAIGMVEISKLTASLDPEAKDITPQITACLEKYNLPTSYSSPMIDAASYIAKDKKRSGDNIGLVLVKDFAQPYVKKVSIDEFLQLCKKTEV
ncbi:MAG: 3-dehydroquinate synthase [Oscillospiraceae bacterium]